MRGVYNCIPEHCFSCTVFTICTICNVISSLKYVLHFCIITFRSMCAVHNMAVFCSSLISCFPGMLLRYYLSDFEMVPIAPIVTFAFAFYMR